MKRFQFHSDSRTADPRRSRRGSVLASALVAGALGALALLTASLLAHPAVAGLLAAFAAVFGSLVVVPYLVVRTVVWLVERPDAGQTADAATPVGIGYDG
ncbi:hypothetical protein ACFQH6_03890 [Halobacteriaceae archaeon GCM10025711]